MTDPALQIASRQLRRDEGVKRHPYADTAGKLTIGIGRNLTDVGLSDDEIDYLFTNDLTAALNWCEHAVPDFDGLAPARRAVLLNMAFNLGAPGLLGFRRMLDAVERGDFDAASAEMLDSAWAKQVGDRAERLAEQMRRGEEV